MNAKLAKNLRKLARERTQGMPYRKYARDTRGNFVFLMNECTRAVYHALKRAAVKARTA